jgi:hypothetical protein
VSLRGDGYETLREIDGDIESVKYVDWLGKLRGRLMVREELVPQLCA